LTYGDVRRLFARAQQVGFPGIALMVGEKHRAAPLSPADAEPPGGGAEAPASAAEAASGG
jgi:hypothetical protein